MRIRSFHELEEFARANYQRDAAAAEHSDDPVAVFLRSRGDFELKQERARLVAFRAKFQRSPGREPRPVPRDEVARVYWGVRRDYPLLSPTAAMEETGKILGRSRSGVALSRTKVRECLIEAGEYTPLAPPGPRQVT